MRSRRFRGAWPRKSAPAPSPAEASAILAEVKRPGASAVLVNVWATWCTPCVEEFPDLLHVARELRPKGLRLVLVSADFRGTETEVDGVSDEARGRFPDLHPNREGRGVRRRPGAEVDRGDPRTFLYDGSGKLVRLWEGKASYPVIKKRALAALATKENR